MPRKRTRKYKEAIATPWSNPTQGSKVARGLSGMISKIFGSSTAPAPTAREIIEYHLTAREREIAYLAALGFTDKEIADALYMNFQTVRVHIRNIVKKLNLEDVSDLRQYFGPRNK